MKKTQQRIIADVILLCAVFLMHWWIAFAFGIAFALFFDTYLELLFAGFILDSLHHAALARYDHFQFVITLACILVLFIIIPLRERLHVGAMTL